MAFFSKDNDYSFWCCLSWCFILVIASVAALLLTVCCAVHHRPYFVKLDQVQASLSQINFTTNDTLHYTVDVNITVRNPNNFYRVHHERIEALNYYKNPAYGFGTMVNMKPFSQGPKSDALLAPSFKGQINLRAAEDDEDSVVVVKLYLENTYKTRFLGWKTMSEFECDLKFPSINGHQLAARFETTEEACKGIVHHRPSLPSPLAIYFFFLILLASVPFVWCWGLGTVASFAALLWLIFIV